MSHKAFLKAIREEPDNDVHRLVYADWLEDHGDPARAEFIRLQLHIETLWGCDREYSEFADRQNDLLNAHRVDWLGPLAAIPDRGMKRNERFVFRRGFVQHATLSARGWIEHGEEVFRHAPIDSVGVVQYVSQFDALLASGVLTRVPRLTFAGPRLGDRRLASLLVHQGAQGLRGLSFARGLSVDEARVLGLSPNVSNLKSLRLTGGGIDMEVCGVLADSLHLGQLEELDFDGTDVDPLGLTSLLWSPGLGGLRSLRIGGGAEVAGAIGSRTGPPRLTKLLTTFSGQFGNVGAADLAASPALAHLEQLDLSGNRLGWRAAEAMARSPYLKRLEYLDLGGNHLGVRGAQALAAGHFPRLRHLDVRFSAIPAAGIAALARSPAFPALHYLALADNGLNNDAVNALCESDRLRELRWLDLEKARLSRRNLDRLRERFGPALRV